MEWAAPFVSHIAQLYANDSLPSDQRRSTRCVLGLDCDERDYLLRCRVAGRDIFDLSRLGRSVLLVLCAFPAEDCTDCRLDHGLAVACWKYHGRAEHQFWVHSHRKSS